MGDFLKSKEKSVLTCVGGESRDFVLQLNQEVQLDFIVATTVVSHGVNLPNIGKVYFTYNVENLDFYLQMLGRGGRSGESFEVHTLSTQYFTRFQIVKAILNSIRKRLFNKCRSFLYSLYAI